LSLATSILNTKPNIFNYIQCKNEKDNAVKGCKKLTTYMDHHHQHHHCHLMQWMEAVSSAHVLTLQLVQHCLTWFEITIVQWIHQCELAKYAPVV